MSFHNLPMSLMPRIAGSKKEVEYLESFTKKSAA